MDEDHTPEFDDFVSTIRFDELCAVASKLRDGENCKLGAHTIGGFNVIYEVVFSDGITWMARIALPYNCFQSESLTSSYAATLKYLKKHSSLPVPAVFEYRVKSDIANKVNATYILMEKLPGRMLPALQQIDLEPDPADVARAKKVHSQLADIVQQLATFKFDKIGSLLEDSDGNFFVAPYVDSMGTAYPQHKATVYESLDASHKGPFTSVLEWYKSMALLNHRFALEDPEEDEECRLENVADYELLAEFADKVVVAEFVNGPFVINHNDLTVQNILVDDDFNITGILDFPGTVVPVPSLCVLPWLFFDNVVGLVTERDTYLDIFINRECKYPSSALYSQEVRRTLMESAYCRQKFELGLLGPYTAVALPVLFEELYGRTFDSAVEYERLAETRPWLKRLTEPKKE